MYLVKRSPYPFIQVYPFIKDLRVCTIFVKDWAQKSSLTKLVLKCSVLPNKQSLALHEIT